MYLHKQDLKDGKELLAEGDMALLPRIFFLPGRNQMESGSGFCMVRPPWPCCWNLVEKFDLKIRLFPLILVFSSPQRATKLLGLGSTVH